MRTIACALPGEQGGTGGWWASVAALPDRPEHKARNEALLREVNERIAELGESAQAWEPDGTIDFLCECGTDGGCGERIRIPLSAYRQARAEADRFVLLPGHETPEIERPVVRTDDYVIVDKIGAVEPLLNGDGPHTRS
jgi:hypothetical protein